MCGISVVYGKLSSNEALNKNKNQLKEIFHRGPDKISFQKFTNCSFGHSRLMIIDLDERSHQPLNNQNFSIVFNGIIYNYLEIKENLKKKYKFITESDTEVILAGYTLYGDKIFKMLRGMFAVVIYDKKKKSLVCARDQLGIKPLYYAIKEKTIFIASEIKPILKNFKAEPNINVAKNYFKFGMYEDNTNTFFKDIFQFQPGSIYKIDRNLNINKKKYWDLFNIIQNSLVKLNPSESIDLAVSRINEIKKIYSRSDVKMGIFLSSGIDSTYLKNILDNENKLKNYFTFGYHSDYSDEIDQIELDKNQKKKLIVKRFSLEDFIENLKYTQYIQEMPWGGPNVFFMEKLSELARNKNIKVMFNADGADEVFGGYDKYLSKNLNLSSRNYFNQQIDGTINHKNNIIKKNYIIKDIHMKLPTLNKLSNMRYLDMIYQKLPRNFRFSDRYSMKNAIELRYPFLDVKIIEDSFKFNNRCFINSKINKIILRNIFSKYKRKKKHINSPQINWLKNNTFKKYLEKNIINSPIFDIILDRKKTFDLIGDFYDKKQSNSFKLWQVINYDIWLRTFFKQ